MTARATTGKPLKSLSRPLYHPTLVWGRTANNGGVYSTVGWGYSLAWMGALKRRHFYLGCFTEIALLGAAALVGAVLNHPMFQDLSWRAADAVWGVVAI